MVFVSLCALTIVPEDPEMLTSAAISSWCSFASTAWKMAGPVVVSGRSTAQGINVQIQAMCR